MCSTVDFFHQRPHGTWGKHSQFWCLILGPLALHRMGTVQDILWSYPLFPIWVALPDLPGVRLVGQ